MAKKEETPKATEKPEGSEQTEQQANAEQLASTKQPEIYEQAGPLTLKPAKITAIAGMRLGSGVCNILVGLAFCWVLFPILLIPLGIVEIVSGSNLLKAKPDRPSSLNAIPILEIIAILTLAGWVSVIVGIISLVFLGDQRVKSYLNQL